MKGFLGIFVVLLGIYHTSASSPHRQSTRAPEGSDSWTDGFESTKPNGCWYNRRHYYPGQVIERGRCWGLMCSRDGQLMHWDDFRKCERWGRTTAPTDPPRTRPFRKSSPSSHDGCYYGTDRKFYRNNAVIEKDPKGCWATICKGGHVMEVDYDCRRKTPRLSTRRPKTRELITMH